MSSVHLQNLGIVCALGYGEEEVRKALLQGTPIKTQHHLRCRDFETWIGEVDRSRLPQLPADLEAYSCINHRLLYAAWLQIAEAAVNVRQSCGACRLGVVLGSSTSGLDATEGAFYQKAKTLETPVEYCFSRQHEMGSMSNLLARLAGAQGPAYVISTACSSSAKAMLSARSLLDLDLCDAVICGGVDSLCDLTLNGFDSLSLISPGRTLPCSLNRKGLNLGEGCALFLMRKGVGSICLTGGGESSDAHHISSPHPEGRGAERAIRVALMDASLHPEDIDYVNLHGTGTQQNDLVEMRAVARVFGQCPCSSTKPMTGHVLGAAGALEAGLCWLVLHQKGQQIQVPPHLYDGIQDPEIPVLELCSQGRKVGGKGRIRFLSTSFAFGGNNCALVLERME